VNKTGTEPPTMTASLVSLRWAGAAALACSGLILFAVSSRAQTAAPPARPPSPEALFGQNCAGCHDNPATRAPDRVALRQFSPEAVYAAVTTGPMAPMAKALDDAQKRSIAEYLTDRSLAAGRSGAAAAMAKACGPLARLPEPAPGDWNGWANDAAGGRYQPAPGAALAASNLGKLKLKWVFGLPGASEMYAQPTVAQGQLFISADTGWVYALDPASGCVRWSFQAAGGVRTPVVLGQSGGRTLAYFGDIKANAYALDARTGAPVWRTQVDGHRLARITGAPVLSRGRLYVPVSSHEEWLGADRSYPCCTFSGALATLDAATGKIVWKTQMIPQTAKPTRKNSAGVQLWGPAGAAIWGSPAVDERRGAIYVSTGDGYTSPADPATNSVIALSLKTGAKLWSVQANAGDAWLGGCVPGGRNENCPDPVGPDYDFAAGLILKTLPGGHSVLVAGQKSGVAWGLDPDRRGAVLWGADLTRGSPDARGQIIWGGAADDRSVYYGLTSGGFAAVDLATGHVRWQTAVDPAPGRDKYRGHGAAVSVMPGAVLSGGWDGQVRAVSTGDGAVLWQFDTARDFTGVNGVAARGGSMGAPGPVAAHGALYVGSGIVGVQSGMPGNALLAFAPD
jgi:polyvinyl alcohol dehydrogenase (cytochrome)